MSVSHLVYLYTNLRKIVLTSFKNKGKDPDKFIEPELIVTQKSEKRTFKTTLLKYEITPDAILKFVDLNRKYLKLDDGGNVAFDKTGSNTETFYFENGINTLKSKFDGDIVEFNDDFGERELLYAIVVNR